MTYEAIQETTSFYYSMSGRITDVTTILHKFRIRTHFTGVAPPCCNSILLNPFLYIIRSHLNKIDKDEKQNTNEIRFVKFYKCYELYNAYTMLLRPIYVQHIRYANLNVCCEGYGPVFK